MPTRQTTSRAGAFYSLTVNLAALPQIPWISGTDEPPYALAVPELFLFLHSWGVRCPSSFSLLVNAKPMPVVTLLGELL